MAAGANKLKGAGLGGKKTSKPVAYGEVLDIILDDGHSSYDQMIGNVIGSCRVRIMPDDIGKDHDLCSWIQPMSLNNLEIPLIGEIVTLVRSGTAGLEIKRDAATYYWTSYVSIYSELHNNNLAESTAGKLTTMLSPALGDYTPEVTHHPLGLLEGDKLLIGRYGQTIRFTTPPGSTSLKPYWKDGKTGSPVLILSTGTEVTKESKIEDLEKGSHIALTKDVQVNDDDETKDHSILLKTEGKITNEAKVKLTLKSEEVQINSKEWDADWTTFMDILKALIAEVDILSKGTFPTGVGPTGPHPSVPGKIAKIKADFDKLAASGD